MTIRTLPGSLPLASPTRYSSNRFLISAGVAGEPLFEFLVPGFGFLVLSWLGKLDSLLVGLCEVTNESSDQVSG